LWCNLCNRSCSQSKYLSISCVSRARDVVLILIWQRFFSWKRKIKSKVKNRRDSLNDFTHVHIYRHTRTRLPASHIFAFMSRSVCTQNRGLLSHKYFVRALSFASSPQVFKNSRLQTRFCYYIFSLRTKVAESVLRRGSRNASGGIYWDACHLSWVLFYRLVHFMEFSISYSATCTFRHATNLYDRSKTCCDRINNLCRRIMPKGGYSILSQVTEKS